MTITELIENNLEEDTLEIEICNEDGEEVDVDFDFTEVKEVVYYKVARIIIKNEKWLDNKC